jgi:uncharacterized Zn finger protein (UPF0148 family)
MAETTVEKATCGNCGVEVREGTTFCYNCGKPLSQTEETATEAVHTSNGSVVSPEARSALDELAERLKIAEPAEDDKLAKAAAERKRARVRARRSEVVWEPADDGRLFVVFTLLIAVMTAVVVLIAVYWK